jgi:hypothetical protein
MIIFNRDWLQRLDVCSAAKQWKKSDIISSDQYKKIAKDFNTSFYAPSFFIRVLNFFLTQMMVNAALGIFAMMLVGLMKMAGLMCILGGAVIYLFLEHQIKIRHLFKSGIDDALLYFSAGMVISGCMLSISSDFRIPAAVMCMIALPPLLWGAVRFGDVLLTIISFVCFLLVFMIPLAKAGKPWASLLPFAGMILSAPFYFFARKGTNNKNLFPWKNCLTALEISALLVFYLSGNYLVVRELSVLLLHAGPKPGDNISLAFLFYAFTILTPILYLAEGIHGRDQVLLRTGLFTAVLSVLTFKYYYSLAPPEISLTVGGIIMIVLAAVVHKLLKNIPAGITSGELMKDRHGFMNIENLAITQEMKLTSQQDGLNLGGGEFGGGGADGRF